MRTLSQARPTMDQVLDQARSAVASARQQRDAIHRELEVAEAENQRLRRQLAQPAPASAAPRTLGPQTLEAAATPLIEVIDHLGRALLSRPAPEDPWFKGMAAVLARARAGLENLGVFPVGTVGERFDPRLHEAVGTLPTNDFEPDSIVDVLDTGLRTRDGTLLRAARVVVATAS